ncbi:MAG: glycosyltransferase, partial [Flavobacteriales bacterium]
YLVDDDLLSQLEFKPRLIEKLKRIGFYLTTKMVDTVVVQSSYMKNMLIKKYPKHKFFIQIIPNPISSILKNRSESLTTKVLIEKREASITTHLKLLYVSRYYLHKNHQFLIQLSKLLNQKGIPHNITVTVDPSLVESQTFLRSISSRDISIINIGELKQEELAQYYENTHMFLFPSRAETFGNPLIEAMCYALPVIVPDLEYARSIVGSAGLYYSEDNAVECMEIIKTLVIDSEYYFYKSNQSFEQFKNYPTTTEWFEKYMTLIR